MTARITAWTRLGTWSRRAAAGVCVSVVAVTCGLLPGVASAVAHHLTSPAVELLPESSSSAPRTVHPDAVGCRSDAIPVVLLHGERSIGSDLAPLASSLRGRGLCVFTPTYGVDEQQDSSLGGMATAYRSADNILSYLQDLRSGLGRRPVVVGVDAAGVLMHHLIASQGASSLVEGLITVASPLRGWVRDPSTPAVESWEMRHMGELDRDLRADSDFLRQLHSMPLVNPSVRYVVVATQSDDSAVRGAGLMRPMDVVPPGVDVRLVSVQAVCPGVQVSRDELTGSATVADLVAVAANPSLAGRVRPSCPRFPGWAQAGLSSP